MLLFYILALFFEFVYKVVIVRDVHIHLFFLCGVRL